MKNSVHLESVGIAVNVLGVDEPENGKKIRRLSNGAAKINSLKIFIVDDGAYKVMTQESLLPRSHSSTH